MQPSRISSARRHKRRDLTETMIKYHSIKYGVDNITDCSCKYQRDTSNKTEIIFVFYKLIQVITDKADRHNTEETLENIEDSQDIIDIPEENADIKDNTDESMPADNEYNELLNKQVPSSIENMTYNDMIDDDFQYGRIVDESYKDSDNPPIDLGESAPFTQGDIMDEILSAVGMTHDDMADDERIDISEKDRKLMRLENFLEKVQHNKESR